MIQASRIGISAIGWIIPNGSSRDLIIEQPFVKYEEPNLVNGTNPVLMQIPDWNPTPYLGAKGWKFMSRPAQLLCSVWELVKPESQAGQEDFNSGIYIGSALSNKKTMGDYDRTSRETGPDSVSAKMTPAILANFPGSALAIRTLFRSSNLTFSAGGTSGFAALETAYYHLLDHRIERAIVGSVEEMSEMDQAFFEQEGYDGNAKFVESSVVAMLETEESLKRRGATPPLWLLAVRSSVDRWDRTISECLKTAGLEPSDVQAVILSNLPHASLADKEMQSIAKIWSEEATRPNCYTLAADWGHLYSGHAMFALDQISKSTSGFLQPEAGAVLVFSTDSRGLFSVAAVKFSSKETVLC